MGFPSKEQGAGGSGVLGSQWTQGALAAQTLNLDGSGDIKASAVSANEVAAYRNENTFNPDQYAKAIIRGGLASGTNAAEVWVRTSGSNTTLNSYSFFTDGVTGTGHTGIDKWTNGVAAEILAIATTFATGDEMKLAVVGNVLTAYKNGAVVGTVTDSTYATGAPGMAVFNSGTNNVVVQNFEGGNVAQAFSVGTRRVGNQRGPFDGLGFLNRGQWDTSVAATASSPITVTPDVGALVLTGFEPTIGLPLTILPNVGALALTGFAPSVGLPVTVAPSLGQLLLAGFAPSIGLPLTLTPGLGAGTLTGFAPTVGLPQTVTPGLGALSLTGFAPAVGLPLTVTTGLGALQITGFAPVVDVTVAVSVQPGTGDLALDGFAPTVGLPLTVTFDVGALDVIGYEPAIDAGISPPIAAPLTGGHRLPNRYVDIDLGRARARSAKRKLDEERRRLSELKRQQAKVEVQYKSIPLVEKQPVTARSSDRAHLLELEIKEYEQRVSLQAARVKAARKASELARREAEAKQSADDAVRASEELRMQSEWQRIENERLQQEDDEMMQVLLLVHEEL